MSQSTNSSNSDAITNNPTGYAAVDTLASVRAAALATAGGDQGALDTAVMNAMAGKAPVSDFETWLGTAETRFARLEDLIGTRVPALVDAVNAGAGAVAAIDPGAAPFLARLPVLEDTVNRVLKALGLHFGGKIAGLPPSLPAPVLPAPALPAPAAK